MLTHNLLYLTLIKKLMRSGKKRSSIFLLRNFLILSKNKKLLHKSLAVLSSPVIYFVKRKRTSGYNVHVSSHYYKSLVLAIKWLIKGSKERKNCKLSLFKKLYLECQDVLKKQGIAHRYKKNTLNISCLKRK